MPETVRSLSDVLEKYQTKGLGYKMDYINRSLAAINLRTGIHTYDVSNESYTNLSNAYLLFAFAKALLESDQLPKENILPFLNNQLNRHYGFKILKNEDNKIHFVALKTFQTLIPIFLPDEQKFVLLNKETGKLLTTIMGDVLELNLLELLVNSQLTFSEIKEGLIQQSCWIRSDLLLDPEINRTVFNTMNVDEKESNKTRFTGIQWNTWQYEQACNDLNAVGKEIYAALKANLNQQHQAIERNAELETIKKQLKTFTTDDTEIKEKIKALLIEIEALERSGTIKQHLAKTIYYTSSYLNKELSYEEAKAKLKSNNTAMLEALSIINLYQLKHGQLQYAVQKLEEKKETCTHDQLKQYIEKLLSEIKLLSKARIENQFQLRVAAYNTLFLLDNELTVDDYQKTAKQCITSGKPSSPYRTLGIFMFGISVAAIAAGIITSTMAIIPIAIGTSLVGGIMFLSNREKGLYKMAKTIAKMDENILQIQP